MSKEIEELKSVQADLKNILIEMRNENAHKNGVTARALKESYELLGEIGRSIRDQTRKIEDQNNIIGKIQLVNPTAKDRADKADKFKEKYGFPYIWSINIEALDIPFMLVQTLKVSGQFTFIGDLVASTKVKISSTPRIGKKALTTLKKALLAYGLDINQSNPNWPKKNTKAARKEAAELMNY